MSLENTNIIRQLQKRDEQSFDKIYTTYYKGLCAFASQYVEQSESEDIVQDTMVWLWENASAISVDMSLKSLLFTIVKNKCLNAISHVRTKSEVHEKLYKKFSGQFEDPDFYMENELMEHLEKAIAGLPEDYREAFELNRFRNFTYEQIAQQAGVSSKTIAYRICQALKSLRKELSAFIVVNK